MTFLVKKEEEASLAHAQCAHAHVTEGIPGSWAGEAQHNKKWSRSNVKNTITFKLYKVSIPSIQ